ncbi:MAG: N-6 DNA methylase [Paludibacteraceae bacterium]|nr:N-6 DNA methylase [Paludibacteraceae bacterium]
MITKDNFQKVLEILGFEENNDVYSKTFPQKEGCTIGVDFKNKQLFYPEELGFKINDRTTCNFEHPENFVVFECVYRLFEKGYRPEHIELEKRWNLGHDAKGGKADICVYDKDGKNMLLIIECKTAGSEHLKALKQLKEDGGQLFSYWQQERSSKWLSLYASDFKDEVLSFENYIIDCSDDENVKKQFANDKSIRLFENAQTVKDLFEVWDETYDKLIHEKGVIFGEDSQAYQIGVPPLRKKRLEDFKSEDKIVNRFEEILRHNNVSDKENAFNRLVALFICKLVDEMQKSDDDIVEFQYKVGTDSYESLQDRLQRLHKEGMEKFMGEEIYYVSDDYAENLFAQKLNDNRRRAAIEDLRNTIRILKFYSNNDFAFKDVHNEELFFQNGKILVEVVQLFQKYRIVYPSKHQFLGDLFEQLLNKGFKQNEGQFFTPMPITRFIWDCLPLDKIVRKKDNFVFPKVIDYACGAGHFLTEAVEAINSYFIANGNIDAIRENMWCEHHIFGIEKDYRLARVAKVSLYMNGAGQGKIKFGDGLEQYTDEQITNSSFDILVANPPYSVSGFKGHLKLKNNSFELLERNLISNDGSEIETLFVERIAQLLKPKGIAAVVLPSSILSNDSNSYMCAREIILQFFHLRAVAQFGSKTFGATGTNTVVLYLEKFNEPPKRREIVKDVVNAILSGKFSEEWDDKEVFQKYIKKINVTEDLYKSFATETATKKELEGNEYFAQYIAWFDNLTEVQNKRKSNKFKKSSEEEQKKEIKEFFFKKVKEVESEKLIYFTLVHDQITLTITAPADNAEQKKFLGYDWSNRKGAEGIQISHTGGLLYNDTDRYATDTIAAAVRFAFDNKQIELPEPQNKYCAYINTHDMIDFSRTSFNKAIKLTADKKIEIKSKWPLVKFESIVSLIETGSRPTGGVGSISEGVLSLGGEHIDNTSGYINLTSPKFVSFDYYNKSTRGKLKKSDLLICKDGALTGKVAIVRDELDGKEAMINEHVFIIRCKEKLTQFYLFEFLYSVIGQNILKANITGSAQGGLNSTNLKAIKIPLPPLDIQQQVVSECEKVDEEYNNSRMTIEEYKRKIAEVFERLEVISKSGGVKINKLAQIIKLSSGKMLSNKNRIKGTIPVYGGNGITGYHNEGFIHTPTIVIGRVGEYCGSVHLTESEAWITDNALYATNYLLDINKKFLFYVLKQSNLNQYANRTGQPNISQATIANVKIPYPNIEEQNNIVSEIESYESKIAEAKAVMAGCAERKKKILEKWLR